MSFSGLAFKVVYLGLPVIENMVYLLVSAVIVVCLIIYFVVDAKRRRRNQLDAIRMAWGSVKIRDINFHRAGRYARQNEDPTIHSLSQQTLDDIDFYKLFAFVDRTTSALGQQYLYRELVHPSHDRLKLAILNDQVEAMGANVSQREAIQLELTRLDQPHAYSICNMIAPGVLPKPAWMRFLPIGPLLVVVSGLLAIKFQIFFVVLLIPVTLNVLIHYWHRAKRGTQFGSFSGINTLVEVASSISGMSKVSNPDIAQSINQLKPLSWKLALLKPGRSAMQDDLSQFGFFLAELLNGIFLIEVLTILSLEKILTTKRDAIKVLFDFVGWIDMSISIASLRAGKLKTCVPVLTDAPRHVYARNLYHPLVRNCVKNDIDISGKSLVITGSNMSGKTTLLRTIMINSILAQSIHTCFADEFRSPILRQFSSIRIDDNLFEGRSYFFEEVNVVGLFIEEMRSGYQNLFVLDEVFRGTNSIERTALGKAILSYLNQGDNIVIVSTHDLELAELLNGEYDGYHFSETIEEGRLHFDHTLKPGPLKTRNAINLLELANFPEEIVSEARNLSADTCVRSKQTNP